MRVATERIDLTKHTGQHPRMGATDVVPFVPVRDMTMDECVALARRLAERAATELAIPIYLYARAATRPDRERLPDIRKGEFEDLRDRIGKDPGADPDFGPRHVHPTAGVTAIGARPFLVAFNIYLDTGDVAVAKQIARQIRTSSGGLPAVQASGFEVGGKAQVSMNLLDIDTTSPATVFAAVESRARARWRPPSWRWSPGSRPGGRRMRPSRSGSRRSSPRQTRCGPSCAGWWTTTPPPTPASARPIGSPKATPAGVARWIRRWWARRRRRCRWRGGRYGCWRWRGRSGRSATRTRARTPP